VQDPALEAEADRLGSQVAAQIGSSPGLSRQIVQRSVRDEEVVSWSCAKCHAQQTSNSKFRKPDKDGCPQDKRKGHDWKLGTTSERRQALTELHISSKTSPRPVPEHFSEAETWTEAYELLAPWGDYQTASATLEGIRLFSNVGSAAGALALYRGLQGSGSWTRGRRAAITAVTSHENLLQHTGALEATITLTDEDTVTFFGVAANIYKVCEEPPGPWVFDTLPQTGCSGGTCHTEQLCLYRLHQQLVALGDRPSSVRLQWYTEKVMCTLWCVPTLGLFTEFWQDKGLVIDSIPSERL